MHILEGIIENFGNIISFRLNIPQGEKLPGVIIQHGYSGCKEEYNELANVLAQNGFAVLQFDARGTGNSSGIKGNLLCSTEWIDDALAAVTYFRNLKEVDKNRLGFTGCSIGGATTIKMAALDNRLSRVASMAPFSNGEKLLKQNFKKNRSLKTFTDFQQDIYQKLNCRETAVKSDILVADALGFSAQDTNEYIKDRDLNPQMIRDVSALSVYNSFFIYRPEIYAAFVQIPTMILHGDNDTIVDFNQGKKMFALLKCKKEFVKLNGAPHNIPASKQRNIAFENIVTWFKEMG